MYVYGSRSRFHHRPRPKSFPAASLALVPDIDVKMLTNSQRFDRLLGELHSPTGPTLVSVEFEVYGNVQGTFFAKYCKEMCNSLRLRGWVRNSRNGTVVGKIQGVKELVDDMAMWLRLQGSPGSKIDHCAFRNWSILDGYDFRDFRILY